MALVLFSFTRHGSRLNFYHIVLVSYEYQNLFYSKCHKSPTRRFGGKVKCDSYFKTYIIRFSLNFLEGLRMARSAKHDDIEKQNLYNFKAEDNVDRDYCLQKRFISQNLKSHQFK